MKKLKTLAAMALSLALTHVSASAANLTDQDKKFLSGYEKTQTALAADNLDGAKAAATEIGDTGANLVKSSSLKDARAAFEKLTIQARKLASGQPGYHVFHCPMLNKDWVQTSTAAANPYAGKAMAGCGELQK